MYKIILVDDERPTLDMLENYIDWEKDVYKRQSIY